MHHIDGVEKDQLDSLHPACTEVLHYWQERADVAGGIPKLTDIDLMELWRLASHITIKDIERKSEDAPIRFRWRYAGTMLYELTGQELTGQELTGRYMDDVFDAGDDILEVEKNIVLSGTPHFWKRSLQYSAVDQSPVTFECLTMPLTNAHGDIAHTFSVIIWSDDDLEVSKSSFHSNGRYNEPNAQDSVLITQ